MKKLFTLILLAATVVACGGKTYNIKGTVTPTDDLKNAFVVFQNAFTGVTDTAMIINGKFSFTGEADTNSVAMVGLAGPINNGARALFVPEKGNIVVDLDSSNRVTAGPLTERLQAFLKQTQEATDDETFMAALTDTYKANKTNGIGLFAIGNFLSYLKSEAELDEYLDGAADFIVNNEQVLATRKSLKASEQTSAGKPFKEIVGFTSDGKQLNLSDFAGKGKYVLIDFWASWCGPCKREIPNLIAIAKDYAKKNVQVVGINVWDQDIAAFQAVSQLGINYPVIFTHDNTSTDDYGVQGIPQILLIGPDGTILERNLRGEGIAATLDKYVK